MLFCEARVRAGCNGRVERAAHRHRCCLLPATEASCTSADALQLVHFTKHLCEKKGHRGLGERRRGWPALGLAAAKEGSLGTPSPNPSPARSPHSDVLYTSAPAASAIDKVVMEITLLVSPGPGWCQQAPQAARQLATSSRPEDWRPCWPRLA